MIIMRIMRKKDLITMVARQTGDPVEHVAGVVNQTVSILMNTVASGRPVSIVGLGKFFLKRRSARLGVNPVTKKKIQIGERQTIKFVPGKVFKDTVGRDGR